MQGGRDKQARLCVKLHGKSACKRQQAEAHRQGIMSGLCVLTHSQAQYRICTHVKEQGENNIS